MAGRTVTVLSAFKDFTAVYSGFLGRRSCCMRQTLCRYSSESGIERERDEDVDDVENKRNISRLPQSLRDKMYHVMKPPSAEKPHSMFYLKGKVMNRNRARKIYAKYGRESGQNPGVMWPSKEELAEIIAEEKEFEPTLQELMENARNKKNEELEAIRKREAQIDAGLAKMPKHITAFRKKLQKRGQETMKVEMKQQQLLAEARDHFGFEIHPHDPRFKELKEAKIEEERKKRKAMQREKRDKKITMITDNKPTAESAKT